MAPIMDLSGKVAVVIGGTSGIGRTLSLGLADAGANVVASGRNAANVEKIAREIKSRGRETLTSCGGHARHELITAAVGRVPRAV